MRIVILHHDLEWAEKEMKRKLEKRSVEVLMCDIRNVKVSDVHEFNPDLVLNRVYASVANRDFSILSRTLKFLVELEKLNLTVINNYNASKSDYSKNFAFLLMKDDNVFTPYTVVFDSSLDLKAQVEKMNGFPLIVKRDLGGRGIDVAKCDNFFELENAISRILRDQNYDGDVIIQDFISSVKKYDYRIWVLNDQVVFAHKRSLISLDESLPWLASVSKGSELIPFEDSLPEDLKLFALKAAKTVHAYLDVLDIIETEQGFCVIEHNLTPNLRPKYEKELGIFPMDLFVENLQIKYEKEVLRSQK